MGMVFQTALRSACVQMEELDTLIRHLPLGCAYTLTHWTHGMQSKIQINAWVYSSGDVEMDMISTGTES